MKKYILDNKRILTYAIILALLLNMLLPLGVNATEAEDELNEVEEQAEEARTEKAQMMEDLAEKEARLEEINGEINTLQGEIDAKQAEIEAMLTRISEIRTSISEQKGGLGNRLRNMYKSGSVGMFDVLLDSGNFSEFMSNMTMVQKIYDSDQKTLMELEAKRRELEQILADLEVAKAELDEAMAVMEEKKAIAEEAKAEVEAAIAEIQARIDEYEAEAARLAEIVAEEQAELERQMEEARRAAEEGNTDYVSDVYTNFTASSSTGFIWPASGALTSYFGYRTDVQGVGSSNHGGIDIAVPMYTPIVAAKSGYVSGATGWSGGYGYAVYLNHDSNVTSIYGHNSELLVSPGEYVEQGQVIAYSGSTGWSTGPHLHFEIRVGNVPVDPLNYL